ncbi:LysR family transcriptional regulator [Oceanobacillus neutriphilus]|uniref:LysR family transcriptional regulator n=1 Tax=Oceanobacillus neutriphilus TaxID=531815 RepID=A0ABQ2NPU2_9BACI|nr:LysR family transcriptional regulator [Oceanobacillus neutriphilus]GGP07835.1 LysR family transcriptional regulator [Oceanobacillus neutriphilus]
MNENSLQIYRIFNEVARLGNITNAAKNLYISQPAVSSAITNLEKNLGVQLFIRKSRGVKLTENGSALYKHVKSAFAILEKGEYELRKNEEQKRERLSIGMSTIMGHFVIRPFFKKFIEKYPYIDISIVNQSSYKTYDMIEEYELDIGIVTAPMKRTTVEYEPFMKCEFAFVATPSYIENLKQRQAGNVFKYFPEGKLMLLHRVHPHRLTMDQNFYERGFNVEHTLEVSNMDLLIEFSKMGMGIGYVIKNFVQEQLDDGTLIELPIDTPQLYDSFGLAYNQSIPLTEAKSIFIDAFTREYN